MTTFAQQAADTNRVRMALIEESVFGVTPATPAFDTIRWTSESLGLDTTVVESSEVRADRALSDSIRTGISASGEIAIELSWGGNTSTIGRLMKAAFLSSGYSSENSVVATTISFGTPSSGVQTISDSGSGFGAFNVGQWVRVTGAAAAANNGLFKITAAAAGAISVVNPDGVSASAGASVTCVQVAQLIPGTSFTSFTIEKTSLDISTDEYERVLGAAINSMSLSVPSDGIATGSFQFIGSNVQIADAAIASSTYNAATTTPIMNGIDNIVAVYIKTGTTWAKQPATQFDVSLENNLRARLQIGTLGAVSMGLGRVNITGTLRAYLTSGALIREYTDFNKVSLAVVFRDRLGNYFALDLPTVRFTSGRRVGGGVNTDVMADLSFTAQLDETETVMGRWVTDAA